jgi:hypothetical protein
MCRLLSAFTFPDMGYLIPLFSSEQECMKPLISGIFGIDQGAGKPKNIE